MDSRYTDLIPRQSPTAFKTRLQSGADTGIHAKSYGFNFTPVDFRII